MNPPAALHGAMSRERKPFTYTPGGLDLSQIKSERMARRLMINAMNPGVPEIPQQVQSPPATGNPVMVPNFNCLPVQVFPAMSLPANPKSLLRTRSHPSSKEPPPQRVPPPQPNQFPIPSKPENITSTYSPNSNNNSTYSPNSHNNSSYQRPVSMYEYNAPTNNANTLPKTYGSNAPAPYLPEISYEAEFLQAPRRHIASKPIVPEFSKPIDSECSGFVDLETKPRNVDESVNLFQAPTRNSNGFNAVIAQLECRQDNKPFTSGYSEFSDLGTKQQNDFSENYKIPDLNISLKSEIVDSNTNQQDVNNSDTIPNLNISLKTEIVDIDAINENNISESFKIPNISNKSDVANIQINQDNGEESIKIYDSTPVQLENTDVNDSQIDLDFSIQPIKIARIPSPFEKPVEEESRSDDEQVYLKLLYTYYAYIYICVYIVCYTYLLYKVKDV